MSDLIGEAIEPGEERPAHGAQTIRDVARLAGVSIGTASKALNANGRLSAETIEHGAKNRIVVEAIDKGFAQPHFIGHSSVYNALIQVGGS